MDNLLKNELTVFNGISPSSLCTRFDTKLEYFEIEDNNRVIVIHATTGSGTARYHNPNGLDVVVIDYDGFLTGLPHNFQQGKERCDAIVYTLNNSYFLLNELKDRNPKRVVLTKATSQLLSTLREITKVPIINSFVSAFAKKRCLYCNKQILSPSTTINATFAFNRIGVLAQNGLKLSNPQIEALGFELFEFMGNHTINLV